MIVPVVLGGGLGGGLLLASRALRPRPVALPGALARMRATPTATVEVVRPHRRRAGVDRIAGALPVAVERDLRVVGRSAERHAIDKLTNALALAALVALGGPFLGVLGVDIGSLPLVVATVAATAGGFLLPDVLLRSQAAARRERFELSLSSYLDLVNVLLAGGAGVEGALDATASTGDGWAFGELRTALARARTMRRSPWVALGELGTELGVGELVELAATIQLAGQEGARIRASLAARAAALRARQLARVEAAANSASERLGFPTVAMFVGFLALLAYPAIQQIAGS